MNFRYLLGGPFQHGHFVFKILYGSTTKEKVSALEGRVERTSGNGRLINA